MSSKKNTKKVSDSEDDDFEEEEDESEGSGEEDSAENSVKEEEDEEEEENGDNEIKEEDNADTKIEVKDENEDDEEEEEFKPSINGNKRKNDTPVEKAAGLSNAKQVKTSGGDAVKKPVQKQQDSDDEDDENSDIKWKYLEHHGVLFPDYWQKHNVRPRYDGKPIDLNLLQEEMATYWSQTLGTDWEHKPKYRENFSKQFLDTFGKDKGKYDFDKFDFTPIKIHLEEQKEIRKNRSKEEKNQEKQKKERLSDYYAGAILDGFREKVGQFMIEPPTLFKGRGEHPKMGMMKGRIQPEAVVINISKDAPVPKCSVPGHGWSEIVHKQDVTWLASYKDDSVKKQHKYIFLSAESKLKAENDKKKYEKARRLKNLIGQIRENYERKLRSSDPVDRQLGTATYLIDKLALRVGNEKSEEEADTVGCCSLRVEHIQVIEDTQIGFDFLGKDSMRYQNTVKVTEIVWKNMQSFIKNKKPGDDLFDRIDASSLNEYLKSQMEGLTAKVFRTYNASHTLQKELDKADEEGLDKMDLKDKLNFYDEANRNVAILCNHQKTVGKNFDVMVGKMEQRINVYKDYEKELHTHLNKCKKNGVNAYEKEVILEEKDDGKHKMFVKKFPGTKEKIQEAIEKIKKKIDEEQNKKQSKEKNKEIALGTSKTNYNDPRISVVWCKKWEVPVEKVFPKTLIAKFVWAMDTDLEWSF
ncbi:DNA topoisomerase I (macronuclear) [Tetrahymena thermophila SB210]|uniref:DNA topoisomerase I n=1 Tax=Tetrahymena thermophila (strain SB210) TaxID=312017 RepID=Q24BB2_TETTS|nr:DNA topoisomerase I [Tetrahymena thermophila SB210]EAS05059.2 DNA topoisomerase I [Tetrahymena thermophila SB210]|eukprot:XP_001025304.2 DNA topoisomerase I [Tetrahymena thermophila SB210]